VKGLNRRKPFEIKRLRSSLRIAVQKNNEKFLRNILTRIKSGVIVCQVLENANCSQAFFKHLIATAVRRATKTLWDFYSQRGHIFVFAAGKHGRL